MKKLSLRELNRVGVEDFKVQEKTPVVLVLDNIRSALNVGSAFRTADAFALEGIYLCGISATPPHREILKTAIGATESVQWKHEKNTLDTIKKLKEEGYIILPVEQAENSTSLEEFKWEKYKKIALVFGNEVQGVSQEVMDEVEACIEVPQFGTKHSLNIAVCLGIVVWKVFEEWKYKK